MTSFLRGFALSLCLAALVASVLRVRQPASFPVASLLRKWFPSKPPPGQTLQALAAGVATVMVVPLIAVLGGWAHVQRMGEVSWHWVALAVLGAGVKAAYVLFEELIFRGALLSELQRGTVPAAAICVSATVFAMAHGPRDPLDLAILFVDGIGFAAAFHLTRSLWIPALWHYSKNLSVWLVFGRGTIDVTHGPVRFQERGPEWAFGAAGHAGWLDLCVTVLIAALVVWSLHSTRVPLAAPGTKPLTQAPPRSDG